MGFETGQRDPAVTAVGDPRSPFPRISASARRQPAARSAAR